MTGALLVLVVPFVLYKLEGVSTIAEEQSLCPFKMLTGFPCPGCGITKSLMFLYAGELLNSLKFHLFGPLVWLISLFVFCWKALELVTQKAYPVRLFYHPRLGYILAVLLGSYHLIRLVFFLHENNFQSILHQSVWG